LAVTSPEKRSGKSRLFEVLEILVANPWKVITPTEAVIFRKIDKDRPTLLLDETDAIFGKRNGENYEGLRALLNAGNRRGRHGPSSPTSSTTARRTPGSRCSPSPTWPAASGPRGRASQRSSSRTAPTTRTSPPACACLPTSALSSTSGASIGSPRRRSRARC